VNRGGSKDRTSGKKIKTNKLRGKPQKDTHSGTCKRSGEVDKSPEIGVGVNVKDTSNQATKNNNTTKRAPATEGKVMSPTQGNRNADRRETFVFATNTKRQQ